MEIQSTGYWNLLEQPKTGQSNNPKQVKDAIPKLKDRQIRTDSVDFSKEGMAAMREHVQNLPGRIDVEEIMQMREILPKLKMNPEDDFLWAMRNDMQNSLNAIKGSAGTYTLDDLITIRMEAYTKQYDALQKSYADGTRDIYVSDGVDENGKLQFHNVSKEEDFEYLNNAFNRIADSLTFSARSQEIQWQINEKFGKQEPLPVSLPDGYEEKLSGILKRAANTYAEEKEKGNSVNAAALALKYLHADAAFSNSMHMLFSNIKPMR